MKSKWLFPFILAALAVLPLMSETVSAASREIESLCVEKLGKATLPLWPHGAAGEAFMANCIANLTPTPTTKRNYRKH